jgi:putative phosphoribosyl transferase
MFETMSALESLNDALRPWTSSRRFRDRAEAGRVLGARLRPLAEDAPVVLGLNAGGLAVAREVAGALDAPLDEVVVRSTQGPEHVEEPAWHPLPLDGRIVILVAEAVDHEQAAAAAIRAARDHGATRVILAAPVGRAATLTALTSEADDVVCLLDPKLLWSVGFWYDEDDQRP